VLALKILCGFSSEEIARRLFQSQEAVFKRLQRARGTLRDNAVAVRAPPVEEFAERLPDATLGELYRRQGDLERARQHLGRAIEAAPTHAEKALLRRRLAAAGEEPP
jgi:predicted RNA polymerase sigma factor